MGLDDDTICGIIIRQEVFGINGKNAAEIHYPRSAQIQRRIRAILRRVQPPADLPDQINFDEVVVDFKRFAAKKTGEVVKLSRKEFGVLRFLAARAGQVVTRNELLDEVWGHDYFPTARTVDNHIASLRAKLEKDPAQPNHLITIHGVGYKMDLGT